MEMTGGYLLCRPDGRMIAVVYNFGVFAVEKKKAPYGEGAFAVFFSLLFYVCCCQISIQSVFCS